MDEQELINLLQIPLNKIVNDRIHALVIDFNKTMTKSRDDIKYLQDQNKLLKRALKLNLQICERCVKKKLPPNITFTGPNDEQCTCRIG